MNNNLEDFKIAVEAMKETTVPREHCLNVCKMVTDFAADPPTPFPMALLAFAGYYARFDMLMYLISDQARKYTLHSNRIMPIPHSVSCEHHACYPKMLSFIVTARADQTHTL